jgi:hypothetical protein
MKEYRPINIKQIWKTHAETYAKNEKDKIKEKNKDKPPKDLIPEFPKDPRGHDINELSTLGEEAVAEILKTEIQKGDGYDLIYNGIKIDVITQSMNVGMSDFQTGIITPENYNPDQNCDVYVFCRAKPEEEKIWIGGWIERNSFYRIAKLRKKGERIGCVSAPNDGHRITYIALKDIYTLGGMKK